MRKTFRSNGRKSKSLGIILMAVWLSVVLMACGDVVETKTTDTLQPLPTVTPISNPTPVLGLGTSTTAVATDTSVPVAIQPTATPVPIVITRRPPAPIMSPQKGGDEGDQSNDNNKGSGNGKGNDKNKGHK